MNMKTWTNPAVEELEVKMTALLHWTDESEWPNGEWDGNVIVGGGNGGNEGGNQGGNGGNQGGNQGGSDDGSAEGGFGTES